MTRSVPESFGGYGPPRTARGRSQAYGPPPWHMAGRTLALWFRLADPAEARRHVPNGLAMDGDPIVRARFWDLVHDAGSGADLGSRPSSATAPIRVAEAVVAFPVSLGSISGDYLAHMYADDPVYTAFGREVMGWPLRAGDVVVSPAPDEELRAGARLAGRLERDGDPLLEAALILGEPLPDAERPTELPRWLSWKIVPRVDEPGDALRQLVQTGPARIEWGPIWRAQGELSFGSGPSDELEFLRPREVVAAHYWSHVDLSVGFGRVLAEEEASGAAA
jgi:Acetoacetate decarboxylase (ADC)